ncbi:hypothetical protein PEDI_06810 [Persicobacter diffluens]|uniref:Uncharacterized protein n=1 Tax=Persicobacter diffluens TaxID=981 RepID=A0AAN5AIQ5_9BACT|nr:hypothetical protein PEDI_06810 [Persicobacter diffluens]
MPKIPLILAVGKKGNSVKCNVAAFKIWFFQAFKIVRTYIMPIIYLRRDIGN